MPWDSVTLLMHSERGRVLRAGAGRQGIITYNNLDASLDAAALAPPSGASAPESGAGSLPAASPAPGSEEAARVPVAAAAAGGDSPPAAAAEPVQEASLARPHPWDATTEAAAAVLARRAAAAAGDTLSSPSATAPPGPGSVPDARSGEGASARGMPADGQPAAAAEGPLAVAVGAPQLRMQHPGGRPGCTGLESGGLSEGHIAAAAASQGEEDGRGRCIAGEGVLPAARDDGGGCEVSPLPWQARKRRRAEHEEGAGAAGTGTLLGQHQHLRPRPEEAAMVSAEDGRDAAEERASASEQQVGT